MDEPVDLVLTSPPYMAGHDHPQNPLTGYVTDDGDYAGYLKSFSVLKAPVDTFFDSVMVMAEDAKVRRGRLALLRDLRDAMNRVADISKLAT